MPRKSYTYPKRTLESVEREAERRILEMTDSGEIGKHLASSISRDIICICVQQALPEIRKMTLEEFKKASSRIRNSRV